MLESDILLKGKSFTLLAYTPAQQLIQFGQLIMQEGYMQQEANPLL